MELGTKHAWAKQEMMAQWEKDKSLRTWEEKAGGRAGRMLRSESHREGLVCDKSWGSASWEHSFC